MIAILGAIILLPLALIALIVDVVRLAGRAVGALGADTLAHLRDETRSHLPAAR